MNNNMKYSRTSNDSVSSSDSIYDIAQTIKVKTTKFKLKTPYIAEQTGIPKNDVIKFLQFGDERVEIKNDSELNYFFDVAKKIQVLLDKESKSVFYTLIEDYEYFWKISQQLRDELGYRAGDLVDRIKEKIKDSFRLQDADEEVDYTCFLIEKYGIDGYCKRSDALNAYYDPYSEYFEVLTDEIIKYRNDYEEFCKFKNIDRSYSRKKRMEKSLQRINTHSIAEKDFIFKADQQRTILEAYYEKCTDDEGYLLPDHFGSGIQLLDFIDEKPVIQKGWKYIKRAEPWATAGNLKQFKFGDKLPEISQNNPVYQLILRHKRVFFSETSAVQTFDLIKRIKDSSPKVKYDVFSFLKDRFDIFTPKSKKDCEYYKALAEYYDILSLKPPVADVSNYSKEMIYRAVYEIAASSGKLKFSNELVEQAYIYLHFRSIHWTFHMYLCHFLFKYKSLEPLLRLIEEKSREYDENDKEYE